jgi:spermidine synthase
MARGEAQPGPLSTSPAREPGAADWVVPALAVVFLLSGSAGLVHEVVWGRLLGHLFGATSLAVSTVLAAYMGGLALGSWWAGRRSATWRDGRRVYALLEIGIGAVTLVVPSLLDGIEPLYGWLWRRFHFSFAIFSLLRFAIAGALLLVPTMLMGATLPALAEYMATRPGRRLAPEWLYTANLVGAVAGVAAGGFLLLPFYGLWRTVLVAATINVGVGLAVLAMPAGARRRAAADTAAPAGRPGPLFLLAALVSGLLSLGAQVAWTRTLVLVVGSTVYAFSTVLVVTLVGLAVGSLWASRRAARGADARRDLAYAHALMAATLLVAVYAIARLPFWYRQLFAWWQPQSIFALIGMNTAAVSGVLLPPMLFGGAVLPLVMAAVVPPGAHGAGAAVGTIYAVNTVGAIIGAVAGGFVLVPALGAQTTLLAVVLVAAGMGTAFALAGGRRRWAPLGIVIAVVLGVALRPDWHQKALSSGVFEPGRLGEGVAGLERTDDHLLFYEEGRTATVSVLRRGNVHALVINGRINASDGPLDMSTQVLAATIPALLARRAADVFLVGWGSGVSAGAVLQMPIERLVAVELEPAVVTASGFFQPVNWDPLGDPRLTLHRDDARHILLASDATYDVIVSEPSHPWITGVANVFTRDFFARAANRLRPDGIFSQWLQGYQISLDSYRTILATFQSVFPEVLVFRAPYSEEWILIGSRRPLRVDLLEVERRLADPRVRAAHARIGIQRAEHLLAMAHLGADAVRAVVEGAPLNTDDNMYIEFRAPAQMIGPQIEGVVEVFNFLRPHFTPLDTLLADPTVLTHSRERLEALIAALTSLRRITDRYQDLLAVLPPSAP